MIDRETVQLTLAVSDALLRARESGTDQLLAPFNLGINGKSEMEWRPAQLRIVKEAAAQALGFTAGSIPVVLPDDQDSTTLRANFAADVALTVFRDPESGVLVMAFMPKLYER